MRAQGIRHAPQVTWHRANGVAVAWHWLGGWGALAMGEGAALRELVRVVSGVGAGLRVPVGAPLRARWLRSIGVLLVMLPPSWWNASLPLRAC